MIGQYSKLILGKQLDPGVCQTPTDKNSLLVINAIGSILDCLCFLFVFSCPLSHASNSFWLTPCALRAVASFQSHNAITFASLCAYRSSCCLRFACKCESSLHAAKEVQIGSFPGDSVNKQFSARKTGTCRDPASGCTFQAAMSGRVCRAQDSEWLWTCSDLRETG